MMKWWSSTNLRYSNEQLFRWELASSCIICIFAQQLSVVKKVYAKCSCLFFTVFRECDFFFLPRLWSLVSNPSLSSLMCSWSIAPNCLSRQWEVNNTEEYRFENFCQTFVLVCNLHFLHISNFQAFWREHKVVQTLNYFPKAYNIRRWPYCPQVRSQISL